VEFVKMEGLGNDFVVLDGPVELAPGEVSRICDRRRGVGADGVLVVEKLGPNRVTMAYWNADGGAAEICGNGLRCVVRLALDRGWSDGSVISVETPVGPRQARVDGDDITVELGTVEVADTAVTVADLELFPVSVGNPHAVTFVVDPASAPVAEQGSVIERHELFPLGTNVEFAAVRDTGTIELRVWERGVGETLACGSGAAAAVAVASRRGEVGDRVTVRLPGGLLLVELRGGTAWLTGPANTVYRGALPG
jgi:diaminopimelate epimerase